MTEKKRWIVTYTKHIKQKRKVYHDGFLDFHISSRKVILYDETENLLERRTLKKDEVVSSGETLTFEAYLVDVGDPKDKHLKPVSDVDSQAKDQGSNHKSFSMLRPNFKKSCLPYEDRKPKLEDKMPPKNLNPSKKMIRVFKKREMQKYGAAQSSPNTAKPSKTDGVVSLSSIDKEVNLKERVPSIKPAHDEAGKPQNNDCMREHTDSRLSIHNLSKSVSSLKPLRDAYQILSILQKPSPREYTADMCSDRNIKKPVSSTKELKESDASEKESNKEIDTQKSQHPVSSEAVPGNSKNIQDTDIANSCLVSPPRSWSSIASDGPTNDLKANLIDCPNFDLGI